MYIVTCTCPRLVSSPRKGDPNGPLFICNPAGFFNHRPGWEGSHMYTTVHSTCGTICDQLGDPNGPLFILRYYRCSPLRPARGPERSPFLYCPAGHFTTSTWSWNKSASLHYFWTQGPLYCKYFSKNHLWLVIVILKSLNLVVSCIPVLYYVYCICFMPFSEENPLRVASEALNIHLVSCYLVSHLWFWSQHSRGGRLETSAHHPVRQHSRSHHTCGLKSAQ